MINKERMAGVMEGDFVVFLIGMRINQPFKIHKWLPTTFAMSRMLKELYTHPELGLIHHEMWLGRTFILVQYWRSLEQLLAYAKARDAEHLPAWRAFNKSVGTDGSVGIWHETYQIAQGASESIYVNMPPFGLGKAGMLERASGRRDTAEGRLGKKLIA
jgi:hypothetical protein